MRALMGNSKQSVKQSLNSMGNSALSLIAQTHTDRALQIWQSHLIHEYLLASDQRRQVWHCWLSSQGEIANPERAYHFLTQAKSRNILTDVYGCCPAGLVSALRKLGAQARRKEFYAALFGVLKRGGPLAKHVHHLKTISDETIIALAGINDHPPTDRVLRVLLKRAKPNQLSELTWIVSRLTLLIGESQVEEAIVHGGNPAKSVEKLIGNLSFPEPPFAGDTRLQPITTANDLLVTGRTFRNCLADRVMWFDSVLSVHSGRTYFYRWSGDQPAVLSFGRFGSLGWVPKEFCVEGNGSPSEDTRQQVEQVVRTIPEVGPISMRGGMYRYLLG